MIKLTNENFYKYNKNTMYICLIDSTGAISGETMKECKNRCPQIIDKLKKKIAEKEVKIGNCFIIDFFIFIVVRKSYRNKYDSNIIRQIWNIILPQLEKKNYEYRIDIEDYPCFQEILQENINTIADITICNHCYWE